MQTVASVEQQIESLQHKSQQLDSVELPPTEYTPKQVKLEPLPEPEPQPEIKTVEEATTAQVPESSQPETTNTNQSEDVAVSKEEAVDGNNEIVATETVKEAAEPAQIEVVEKMIESTEEPINTSSAVVPKGTEIQSEQPQIENNTDEVEKPSLNQLWYQARFDAWQKRYDDAINSYKTLTEFYPEHADGYGEMGNVYLLQGDKAQAIAAYEHALSIIIKNGQDGAVWHLQRVIGKLRQEAAAE